MAVNKTKPHVALRFMSRFLSLTKILLASGHLEDGFFRSTPEALSDAPEDLYFFIKKDLWV